MSAYITRSNEIQEEPEDLLVTRIDIKENDLDYLELVCLQFEVAFRCIPEADELASRLPLCEVKQRWESIKRQLRG